MANSLLLRGEAGRMDGYVERCADVLRCRVTRGAGKGARLFVRYADGTVREYALAEGGEEQRFPASEGALCGACVVTGDGVLCATDGASREMGRAALDAAMRTVKERAASVEPHPVCDAPEERPPAPEAQAVCVPEPRWPPPPCLASACYDGGRWVSRGEAAQADAAPARGAP